MYSSFDYRLTADVNRNCRRSRSGRFEIRINYLSLLIIYRMLLLVYAYIRFYRRDASVVYVYDHYTRVKSIQILIISFSNINMALCMLIYYFASNHNYL